MLTDPFVLVFFTCPIVVVVVSIVGSLLYRWWFAMPLVTLVTFTILTFWLFNESFAIWVVVYTALSVALSLLVRSAKKRRDRPIG